MILLAPDPWPLAPKLLMAIVLFLSVLLIAACGLIYELIAGTLASYLLGDSVLQFSTVIGTYLFAMGLGSAASRYLGGSLVARFVSIELMVGVVGGFSSSILFLAFAYTHSFQLALYLLVIAVGILVGLEIPLLMRILEGRFKFRDLVSHVLTFDYLGALAASIAFPLWLVPKTRPGPRRDSVRHHQRRRRALVDISVQGRTALPSHLARRVRVCPAALVRRHVRIQLDSIRSRQPALRRRSHLPAPDPLPANCRDQMERRPAPVPQLAFAVQLARRISLSRSAGSSRPLRFAQRAASPGPRRWRRPRRSRTAEVPQSRKHHAGRSGFGNDAPVHRPSHARAIERFFFSQPARPRHQRRRFRLARSKTKATGISSSSISPTRPIIRSANSTPRPFIAS